MPAVPYKDPNNYVKYSGRLAEELAATEPNGAIWANQFDNVANRQGHIETTAQEIWKELGGKVDGFICAVGTGGTLAGVSMGLKEHNKDVVIGLADPMGAALYNYYKHGVLKAEGSSITEGIGQGRITANLEGAKIDEAYQIPDAEALPDHFRPFERGRALPRRLQRDQCRRRDPPCPRIWARAIPSSRCFAITAPATKAGCSTPNSCVRRGCRSQPGSTRGRLPRLAYSSNSELETRLAADEDLAD